MLRSLGTQLSVRDVIAQQGGREEVWRALQAVVQEGQQAKQHVEAQGKVRSLCSSLTQRWVQRLEMRFFPSFSPDAPFCF